jgi:methylmalonyl-CoA decarboxylase subunit alpha
MGKIDELAQKKELVLAAGGEVNIQMQHNLNKMTARERIAFLLDEGSFIEIGMLTGEDGAGVITGYGTINCRLVYIYSEDYTVSAGLLSVKSSKKIVRIMEMALKMGAPLIQIIDSAGARFDEGLNILSGYGNIVSMNAKLSGVIPQIAVVAGPCTGLSAISAALSDITIIAKNSGEIYISASEDIEENSRNFVDKNMYANANKSMDNGVAQIAVEDDKAALSMAKKLIDYLPSNNLEFSQVTGGETRNIVMSNNLDNNMVGNNINVKEKISVIVDADSEIELDHNLSKSVSTVLARTNGVTVGIIANNRDVNEGRLDVKACEKITKFVKLCDCFNITLISLVDTKGFAASIEEENNGLALTAAKMIYSLSEANVPKIALVTGEAYGAAYIALASKETAFDVTYAWPSAKIAITDPATLIKVLNKDDILESETPKVTEQQLIHKYIEESASAYKAAEEGYVDDIILPSETFAKLFLTLDMLQSKRTMKYPKKHGSVLI